ncbi:hypothetical protein PSACC_01006 [Paramicrosporidium saccamoebae]|uniref:Uncharacterized protein n=1 Tax=Paramicrosporidium saccamoebae TaxID=1246581 RepID=A0A2H9TN28_9FUNG|nr:hypothetical protein PSACC_01006 [Paramicrosporidium saccamoebae]
MSLQVRFERCEWASASLTRVRDALDVANVSLTKGQRVQYTLRLYQRSGDDASTQPVLIGRSSEEPTVCWISGTGGQIYKASGEMETIVTKLYEGAYKARQSIVIEVPCASEV